MNSLWRIKWGPGVTSRLLPAEHLLYLVLSLKNPQFITSLDLAHHPTPAASNHFPCTKADHWNEKSEINHRGWGWGISDPIVWYEIQESVILTSFQVVLSLLFGDHTLRIIAAGLGKIQSNFIFLIISYCCVILWTHELDFCRLHLYLNNSLASVSTVVIKGRTPELRCNLCVIILQLYIPHRRGCFLFDTREQMT